MAIVDLPLAERPVNQSVKPFCPRSPQRSWCETEDACHVMLLMQDLAWYKGRKGYQGRTYVAIVGLEKSSNWRRAVIGECRYLVILGQIALRAKAKE